MLPEFPCKRASLSKSCLLLLLLCTFKVFFANAQSCSVDADCVEIENSECIQGVCDCGEYYVIHPIDDRCVKVATYNSTCEVDAQCQGTLGLESRCENTRLRCECFSPRAPQTDLIYSDGRCYIMRPLGDPCVTDKECILRNEGEMQNELGRCVEEVCACQNNAALSLHSMEMTTPGLCQVHCPQCEVIDISILMSCLSGSLFLIAFIYSMILMANPKQVEEIGVKNDVETEPEKA